MLCAYTIIIAKRLFSLGANFPEWWTLSFSRNFPNLEIHKLTTEIPYMSDILYFVIQAWWVPSLWSSIHQWSPCTCVLVQEDWRIYDSLQYLCTQNLYSHVAIPFLAQGVHCLQYKHLAMSLIMVIYAMYISMWCVELSSSSTIACSICCSYSYYCCLELWNI